MTKQDEIVLMKLDWSEYKVCTKCGQLKRTIDYPKGRHYCKVCRNKQVTGKK